MLWYKSTQDPWEYKKTTTTPTFPHKNNHYTYIIYEINEFYSSVSTTYSNLTSSTSVTGTRRLAYASIGNDASEATDRDVEI